MTERVMTKQGHQPKIAEAFKMECEQFGIQLPADFVKIPEYVTIGAVLLVYAVACVNGKMREEEG